MQHVAPTAAATTVAAAPTTTPAGPAEGTTVARIVFDGMPGEGVYYIAKGARLQPETTWSSIADAEAAVRLLTDGDDVTTAGIFRRDGRYEAYTLGVRNTATSTHQDEYWAQWNDNVARTVAGRGLVSIVDGDESPSIMSELDFRRAERYAE